MTEASGPAAETEADRLRRQRAALARFGRQALRTEDVDALLREACELVSQALDVELAKVLELLPDGETMLVRAGVNWQPGVVGQATFPAHEHSPSGYALQNGEPVISNETATESRFSIPDLLRDHGVESMVNVVIGAEGAEWGVLEVDSPGHRIFDEDDILFLQNYANMIAAAIERVQAHRKLSDAAHRNEVLLGELRHRVGNLLTNVRAVARRTRASAADLEEFAEAFDARLSALARTQEILTRDPAEGVALAEVLRQELEAHGVQEGERVVVRGPPTLLPPAAVQSLAMALHELATNASKYGALALEDGRLEVSWSIEPSDEGGELAIRWRESGVAIARPPQRRGMGLQMLEEALPYMLGGSCSVAFHPDGLECLVRLPAPEASAG